MSTCRSVGWPLLRSLPLHSLRPSSSLLLPLSCSRQLSGPSKDAQDATSSSGPDPNAPPPAAFGEADKQGIGSSTTASVPPSGDGPPAQNALKPVRPIRIGSKRRRHALERSRNLPFENLPYQCFQEALKVLRQDRQEKIDKILDAKERIRALEVLPTNGAENQARIQKKIKSLHDYVGELEILADINDPAVKRKFEDGKGDLTKPVYRLLTKRRWYAYDRKIIEQRVSQFHIVPDLLPKFSPTMAVQLQYGSNKIPPGSILPTKQTELPPTLRVQVFDDRPRLLSIAVVDSDVPMPEQDRFDRRCHFLAVNVPLTDAKPKVFALGAVDPETQLAVPWLPPTAQKGAPYHRLSVFVMEQADAAPLSAEALRALYTSARDGFSIKSFRDKFGLQPVGFNLFRTVWDADTEAVMAAHGIPGADVEFKPKRYRTLKAPRKARGWEAKRQGPKWKHLWRYTKRIA